MQRSGDGVVYIATGPRARSEAARSLATLREHSPNLPVAVFVDEQGRSSGLWRAADHARTIDSPHFGFRDKILPLLRRPFARTLFLDADTFVRRPAEPLLEILQIADVAAAVDRWRTGIPVPVPEAFPEPTTGVIALGDDPQVDALIHAWDERFAHMLREAPRYRAAAAAQELYAQHRLPPPVIGDQAAFRWVLWDAVRARRIRFATLPEEAHVATWGPVALAVGAKPWIVHTHAASGDSIGRRLEESLTSRVWLPAVGAAGPGVRLVAGGRTGRVAAAAVSSAAALGHSWRTLRRSWAGERPRHSSGARPSARNL